MFVGGRTLGLLGEFGGGIEGHCEIRMPSAQSSSTVHPDLPAGDPARSVRLAVCGRERVGSGRTVRDPVDDRDRVGTGDIQVTLSWDRDSDVDLHVIAPGGEEIYYARRQSPSGGELDLDSNAGCSIDGVRNENITWPVGRAPRGRSTVRVDYWSSCNVAQTNYTVRVNNGGSVQIVSGSFTGTGDRGGAGSGRTVATFDRSTGPTGVTMPQALSPATQFLKTLVKPQ